MAYAPSVSTSEKEDQGDAHGLSKDEPALGPLKQPTSGDQAPVTFEKPDPIAFADRRKRASVAGSLLRR